VIYKINKLANLKRHEIDDVSDREGDDWKPQGRSLFILPRIRNTGCQRRLLPSY
jgi:hypothetical protein